MISWGENQVAFASTESVFGSRGNVMIVISALRREWGYALYELVEVA